LHDAIFIIRIKEIAASWPDDREQRDAGIFPGHPDHTERRRGAAVSGIVAQLDPVGTCIFRDGTCFNAIGDDFQPV
jgi:hypothetical protein